MGVWTNEEEVSSWASTFILLADGTTLDATCSEGTDSSEEEDAGAGDEGAGEEGAGEGKAGLTVLALAADEGEETAS